MREIKEPDWKILRQLHKVALERFCERILREVERVNSDHSKSFHEKYLEAWGLLRQRNKEMARAFDGLRRSRAVIQIASMTGLGVLTDDEISQFSQETRELVGELLGSETA